MLGVGLRGVSSSRVWRVCAEARTEAAVDKRLLEAVHPVLPHVTVINVAARVHSCSPAAALLLLWPCRKLVCRQCLALRA